MPSEAIGCVKGVLRGGEARQSLACGLEKPDFCICALHAASRSSSASTVTLIVDAAMAVSRENRSLEIDDIAGFPRGKRVVAKLPLSADVDGEVLLPGLGGVDAPGIGGVKPGQVEFEALGVEAEELHLNERSAAIAHLLEDGFVVEENRIVV